MDEQQKQNVRDRREKALKSPEHLAWQKFLDELRNDLAAVLCDRIDAGAVGKLEWILNGGETLQQHVATDSVLLAAEDTCTAMILVDECKLKITAVAQSLGWSISDIRTLFEPTGSFAWQALRAAAEVQTAGSSPAAIAAPQHGPAAFTAADSRQPVEWSKPRSPQQWRDLRTEKDLPDGETWWKKEKRREPQAFDGTRRRVRITRAKAEEWELELDEFKRHS